MTSAKATRILYDGECPFCASYVAFARLKKALSEIDLIDARERPDLVAHYDALGYDIDKGMIVDKGEAIYFGGDAVWAINALVGKNPLLKLLSGKQFLKFIYPALRFGRNSIIRLLGKTPIQQV